VTQHLFIRWPALFVAIIAGVGVFVAAGTATASADAPTAVSVDPAQVSLAGSGYQGHSVFEASDVHVYTDDTSDASYAIGRFPVSQPLASAGTPSLGVSSNGTGPVPSMRLEVDFDGDGTIDGTLVGDPSYLPDWWLTPDSQQFVKNGAPETDAGSGSAWSGTLADWSANFPDAVILQAGYSIGPDEQSDWQIASLTLGATTYAFTEAVPDKQVLHIRDLDAALANDGSAGQIFFDQQGLRIKTENDGPDAYVTQYIAAPGGSEPLGALGQPMLDWKGEGAAPQPQLMVDFTGDGQADTTLTANPDAPDNWYATDASPQFVKNRAPSCSFSTTCVTTVTDWNGSLAGWADQFPAARVLAIGFVLGPGEEADGDILDYVAGATDYTFANTPPTAATRRMSMAYRTPAKIDLSTGVTDPDPGDKSHMVYLVSSGHHGMVTLNGSVATYVPDKGFAGADSFLYFAYDGVSPATQALVNVTVRKADSTLQMRFQPRAPTTDQVPVVRTTVSSAGTVDGGVVVVRVSGQTHTAKVSDGTAQVRLAKLSAGDHTVRASFGGTSTAGSSSHTQTLHVSRPN
jgi:hypothetical protein